MAVFRSSIRIDSAACAAQWSLILAIACWSIAASERTGEAIFKKDCISCHGSAGEGTKKAPHPLVGEKSPAQLAHVISKTMPEDEPGTCTGEDALKVAAYLHDAFYSPDARARLQPPHVELARLTIKQYRNSVADILAGFTKPTKSDDRQGLHGEYFDARGFGATGGRPNKALIDRLDAVVQFDFGTNSPAGPEQPAMALRVAYSGPAARQFFLFDVASGFGAPRGVFPNKIEERKFNPKQFCASWEGSIFAPETGTYEVIVRADDGVAVWVNDINYKQPIIDAAVRSDGDTTQLHGTVFLLAGRMYSIRMELCKGKELDRKKLDSCLVDSKHSFVELQWKMPHGEVEVIPARYLSPNRVPEVAIVNTPFPPDDRSYGWERGTTVSKEWNAAETNAALEVAGYVAERLQSLSGVAIDAPDAKTKLRVFAANFVQRAFRRPLADAEKKLFVDRQFESALDLEQAIKRVVLITLTSPRFLYPNVMDGQYGVASRLSYALWDAPPDSTLLDAAAANRLKTREELVAQAERMQTSLLARAKLHEFLMTWLRTERFSELSKDAKRFPEFNAGIAADLRRSLELFIDDVVWSEKSDFRQLLLSDELFLNDRLAAFYGIESKKDAAFSRVKWESEKRAGVLTHPFMLTGLAYPAESSPIHRGVFVVRGLLGMTLLPPPDAVAPLPPELHPNLTTRERVTVQTKPDACFQCHGMINGFGFTLENFDAVGRFREKEHDKTIDVSGNYETRDGKLVSFVGARQLATLLAGNEQVHAAFAQQLFHHLVKQPVRSFGLTTPQKLRESFAQSNFSVRELMVEIAVMAAQHNSTEASADPKKAAQADVKR